jgi:ABC-type transport system involved in multi-copper enzyme maturation permease subunit
LTPFVAVVRTEVLFNVKRVAPYALMLIFSANAVLWWAGGPAVVRGWAVNSDFYIVWLLLGFSFMMMPLFIALLMGDPVIRDFRLGIDPLIFSKPVSRITYLLGKFCGNFFVLICCQACFALTALVLQAFRTPGMIVLPPRLLPYLQHFCFFVGVSSLALAAICFTVGTLTRNVKLVYGLAVSFYFLYIAWQESIKGLPVRWRIALDPLLFNVGDDTWKGRSADWLNHVTVSYDGVMIANRVLMVGVALVCLVILYVRFSTTERAAPHAEQNRISMLGLTPRAERLYNEAESFSSAQVPQVGAAYAAQQTALPQVNLVTQGWRANYDQFMAALGVELRLLSAERGLVLVAPIILLACGLEVAAFKLVPEVSYSATYAGRTAQVLLLFLFGIAVFYVGETLHRDREARIEPVLWSVPAPNFVLLLSKFAATLLLALALITLVGLTAIGLQLYQGHTPLELQTYFKTYVLISVPGIVFMLAASVALNVLLRDKYLTYAVSLAIGGGFYYLTSQGYHNWLYNPVLYQLWTPADLVNGSRQLTRILIHRVYCGALAVFLLALAHLCYARRSATGLKVQGRLSGAGWSVLVAVVAAALAIITGLIMSAGM